MEKCTFCVQRIQEAREPAKREQREIRDGEITPACAQACPSKAITFGNLKDETSRVVAARNDPRSYAILNHLYTRPAIAYLRSIRRGRVSKG
jgi:molybdopterin-containing oxidoreductase family iron-sulfur binding subunit